MLVLILMLGWEGLCCMWTRLELLLLRLDSIAMELLLRRRLVLHHRRLVLLGVRRRLRARKAVVAASLSIFYQPLLLVFVLVVFVDEVAAHDYLESAENDHCEDDVSRR